MSTTNGQSSAGAQGAINPALLPMAGRWSRFFARSFDIWWEAAVVSLIGGYWLAQNSAWYVETMNGPGANAIASVIFLPLALVLDSLVYRIFGNTPGKALLGLHVTRIDGSRLNFDDYLRRNFALWVAGLALGIPLFNLGTLMRQSSRLKDGRQASYDVGSCNGVRSSGSSLPKKLTFAVLFFIIFAGLSITSQEFERSSRANNPLPGERSVSWTNPVTGQSADIEPLWKPSVDSSQGATVYAFVERTQHAAVYLARENFPRSNLREYINAYRRGVADSIQLTGSGLFSDDGSSWESDGQSNTGGLRFHVTVVQSGPTFWRIAEVQDKPYAYTDTAVEKIRAGLRSTLR